MFVAELFEATTLKTLVICPGGYHPFHPGHFSLYQSARRAFPGADIYYASTNDKSERPFDFVDKARLAEIAGVPTGHFVQVKSPFQAREITQHYDPATTALIFVRSEKDKNEQPQPGGVKKDGSAAYLQPIHKNLKPMSQHGYMAYLPTVEFTGGITSASEIRDQWPRANATQRKTWAKQMYPADPVAAGQILDKYLAVQESVAEGSEKQQYLWHGSRNEIPVLTPQQAEDTGGNPKSNKKAIYATADKNFAIAMGLTERGSDTAGFPNDPQLVLFSGKIRHGQMVYLHKLPMYDANSRPLFEPGGNDREFTSVPSVTKLKPIEVEKVPVDQHLNLIRQPTPKDLELKKYYLQRAKQPQKQGVAEGKVKLYTNPGYFGAEVDDTGFDSLPAVNIPTNQLVGFEPDDKMNQPKSKANVEKIVADLKKGDKLPPILVRKYKNGYQVLDGHHRFWAYKLLGVKSIPSRIVPDSDIEEIGKQGVAEGLEQINEYRDRLLQYVKSLLPTWPDYVLKDWLVPNKGDFSNLPTDAVKTGIMEKVQGAGLTPNSKWQLVPDMKFTMNMFDPMTKQRLIGRAGGTSDLGMGIPKDKERHVTQAALAKQQGGVRKEPVLLIKTPRGYELLEGWHRTIQHFVKYPEGYTGPAYVAVAQGHHSVMENSPVTDTTVHLINKYRDDIDYYQDLIADGNINSAAKPYYRKKIAELQQKILDVARR